MVFGPKICAADVADCDGIKPHLRLQRAGPRSSRTCGLDAVYNGAGKDCVEEDSGLDDADGQAPREIGEDAGR